MSSHFTTAQLITLAGTSRLCRPAAAMVGRSAVATLLVTLLLAWTTSSHTADAQSLAGTLLATPSTSPFAAPLLCLNGGVLLRTPNAANPQLVDVQCACVNGWSGQSCEYRDFCALSNPCLNGGACFNTRTGPLCHCTEQWAGGTCAQPNPCAGEPCNGHGTCLLREQRANATLTAPAGSAALASLSSRQRKRRPVPESPESPGYVPSNGTLSNSHAVGTVVTGHCRCEPGWTGRFCEQRHADVCAAVTPCTIFNQQSTDAEGKAIACGCELAIRHRCTWCLEQGIAFAPGPDADACKAPLDDMAQCPPASAQTIHSCSLMEGTPFGYCVVQSGPLGYADGGNPSSPTVGSRKCHHWIWSQNGCKADWRTRPVSAPPASSDPPPSVDQCLAVPPCSDAETAGSTVCGCQAALSIGCSWCLEQQLALPPVSGNTTGAPSTCRSVARSISQCPSQQAQTIRQCVGVGGTQSGWCSIDEVEQSMGYSLDGTARGPSSNPHPCRSWFWFSSACPGAALPAMLLVDKEAASSAHSSATAASQGDAGKEKEHANETDKKKTEEDAAAAAAEAAEEAAEAAAEEEVTPPPHVSHVVRGWMLGWLSLISLALLLRWLPHFYQRQEYTQIRAQPTAHPIEERGSFRL